MPRKSNDDCFPKPLEVAHQPHHDQVQPSSPTPIKLDTSPPSASSLTNRLSLSPTINVATTGKSLGSPGKDSHQQSSNPSPPDPSSVHPKPSSLLLPSQSSPYSWDGARTSVPRSSRGRTSRKTRSSRGRCDWRVQLASRGQAVRSCF